jgi:uncharacterized protein (DUF934 family)
MSLLENGTIVDDPWHGRDDGTLIDLATWQSDRTALLARNVPLALTLGPSDRIEPFAADVHRFAMIALDFPAFTDGRPYSTARLLRERFGYRGELRATGDVQRDQIAFMERCGFDAFQVETEDSVQDYAAAVTEISVTYQPVGL